MKQLLGTRIVTGHNNQPVCYAQVKDPGAMLPYDIEINEYIAELQADLANANEGARLMYSVATGGEQSALSHIDNHVDTVDAGAWEDAPEYKEAQKVSDNFDYNSVPEVKF
jgi:hypothetical protein